MPITLYQIQTKFRNEERPRFGVLRTSEFIMKDAYSFDTSVEGLSASYEKMYKAYCRIFDRAGAHLFGRRSRKRTDRRRCQPRVHGPQPERRRSHRPLRPKCGYAANLERAETGQSPSGAGRRRAPPLKPLTKLDTPNVGSIEQVSKLLKCKPHQMIKTLIYLADEHPVAVLVRGDHEANEGKIRRALGVKKLGLAEPDVIQQVTKAAVGFAGPVGLSIPVWADYDIAALGVQRHYRRQRGRQALRRREPGPRLPDCRRALRRSAACRRGRSRARGLLDSVMELKQAIEIGHVFKLGTKYSDALEARFLDDHEHQHTIIMGCYGIGVNRIIAALVETSHDENGIVWPMSLAPYEVIITPLNVKDADVMLAAERLYGELQAAGVDVLLDDRDQRPGVTF